jgi:nicotinate-nucleotide--dimethylbenzimidazole phosphoribosyltransferase
MSEDQLARAMRAGRDAVRLARSANSDLFIGGEMGIANTTAASALACAILQADPLLLAGPGTGLDSKGVRHKAQVIAAALARHDSHINQPIEALRYLGGFEIAALVGAYISCAQEGLPVLVDGFITSVAALAASQLHSGVAPWLLFSHLSSEPGHRAVLDALRARPLLDLGMRLGEGSGAAAAVPLLRLACALHKEMATFAEAKVSQQTSAACCEPT